MRRTVTRVFAAAFLFAAVSAPARADEIPPEPQFDASTMSCPSTIPDCTPAVPTPSPSPAPGPRDFSMLIPDAGCGRAECGGLTLTVPTAPQAPFVSGGLKVERGVPYLEFSTVIAPVVVTDTRLGLLPWRLTGQLSSFWDAGGKPGTLSAMYAGWEPAVISHGAGAAAGPVVETAYLSRDDLARGLSVPQTLASAAVGHAGDGDAAVAEVGGTIRVTVPVTHPSGDYRTTLTLTLMG